MSTATGYRDNLVGALMPPTGYRLDGLVGTTYGLDIISVMALLLGLSGDDECSGRRRKVIAPHTVLKAVIQLRDKVRVFADRSNIAQPDLSRVDVRLITLLDAVICDVRVPEGCFHPKVWVARYVRSKGQGPPLLRVLCSSRNLGSHPSWELFTALVCEQGTRRRKPSAACADVADLLQALDPYDPAPAVRRELIASLRRARLQGAAWQTRQARLRWQGLGDAVSLNAHLPPPADHALLVSPFVRQTLLAKVLKRYRRLTLITTAVELNAIYTRKPDFGDLLRREGNRVLTMVSGLAVAGETGDDGEASDMADEDSQVDELDLHAKLLIVETGENGVCLLGSANATNAAWNGRNVEAMMELVPGLSIDRFLDHFVYAPDSNREALNPWLCDWVPRRLDLDDSETRQREQQDAINDIFSLVATVSMNGTYDMDRQVLVIHGQLCSDSAVELCRRLDDAGAMLSWTLLSRVDREDGQPLDTLLAGARVEELELQHLTDLVAVELCLADVVSGVMRHHNRVFRAQIEELTLLREARDHAIYKKILDAAHFDALLESLLTGLPPRPVIPDDSEHGGVWGANGSERAPNITLERMMQVCAEEPYRVREIRSLVKAFDERVAPGFKEVVDVLCDAFGEARGG